MPGGPGPDKGRMRQDSNDPDLSRRVHRAALAWWRDIRAAQGFLTRIPVGRRPGRDESGLDAPLQRPVRAFPIVGGVIGLFAGLIYAVSSGIGLPDIVSAVLAVGALALVTGALHEDGLSDMADGFGGGRTRADKLAIMKDSRIGAYGVIALVVAIAAKVGAVVDMERTGLVIAAMVAAAAVSRAAMPAVALWLEPARSEGLAADAGLPPSTHVWTGVAIALVLAVGLLTWAGLVAFVVAACGAACVARLARWQIGGYTGDVLGGVQQMTELLFLLAVSALL